MVVESKIVGSPMEEDDFYEITNLWNEKFGEKRGHFILVGAFKTDEVGERIEGRSVVTVDPRFREIVSLKNQAEIYRGFIRILNKYVEMCEHGVAPSVPH